MRWGRRIHSNDVLARAEMVQDEAQIALAVSNLSSVTTALGRYPEALRSGERVEEIRARQGDLEAQPYDQANPAGILIRLWRREDANRVRTTLEAGVSSKAPIYLRLARRFYAASPSEVPQFAQNASPARTDALHCAQVGRKL